jgi:predicted transcriptional regulator
MIGDIVWSKSLNCLCVIERISDHVVYVLKKIGADTVKTYTAFDDLVHVSRECISDALALSDEIKQKEWSNGAYKERERITEIARLREMIKNFCDNQSHAVEMWKQQEHIKPLFEEARK